METTLNKIVIKAQKLYLSCIATENNPTLTKNPNKGGIPAIKSIVKVKAKARDGFDFFNPAKSPNSLLYLCEFFFFFNAKV